MRNEPALSALHGGSEVAFGSEFGYADYTWPQYGFGAPIGASPLGAYHRTPETGFGHIPWGPASTPHHPTHMHPALNPNHPHHFGYDDYFPPAQYGFGHIPWGPASTPHHPAYMHPALQAGFGHDPLASAEVGAMIHPPQHPSSPAHPEHAAHAAVRWELGNPTSTAARTMLLDPNRDSTVKVQRYSFSFSPAANLVLGTASNIPTFTQQPSTSIKGQRVLMNSPIAGFVLVSTLQIANVNVLVGGTEDAFNYSAGAFGVMLDLPRLDPQNRATAAGAYTGVLPAGFTAGNSFQFIITLQGPATLAGGYGQ